jgi:hypothetical protein
MNDDTDDIGAAIRATATSVEAPSTLRERLAAPQPRLTPLRRVAGLAAVAAVIAAVVLVIGAGGPTVQQVAAAALHAPTEAAGDARAYGDWLPIGARTDSVEGKRAHTVIYRRGATGVHYAIVDGEELELPGARRVKVGGTTYALATDGDVRLVAWHRDGKTCVLASRMEDLDGLLRFAAYGK